MILDTAPTVHTILLLHAAMDASPRDPLLGQCAAEVRYIPQVVGGARGS